MNFDDEARKVVRDEIGSLYVSLKMWFLSDDMKYDEDRLKRLFNGCIDNIKRKTSLEKMETYDECVHYKNNDCGTYQHVCPEYHIRPAPGTCCPDMKLDKDGICEGCGTKHA